MEALAYVVGSASFSCLIRVLSALSQPLLSLSCVAQNSLFWVGEERNGPLWQHSAQLEEPLLTHHSNFSWWERSEAAKVSLDTELCHLGGAVT